MLVSDRKPTLYTGRRPCARSRRRATKSSRAQEAAEIPVSIVPKPVLTGSDEIRRTCLEANAAPNCIGVIAWMHTFSPAKAWIAGLEALQQPLLHLHTQANRSLPWGTIDMDFMNLNQSAHGDREFGYITTRLGIRRKVVAGHVSDPATRARIGAWLHAAAGWHASREPARRQVRGQHARCRGDRWGPGRGTAHLWLVDSGPFDQRPRRRRARGLGQQRSTN